MIYSPSPMQKTQHKCPDCGAELTSDAPEGVCPQCLIQLGLSAVPEASEAELLIEASNDSPASSVIHRHSSITKVRYFGDYELLEEIAQGGMGVIFKARQVSLKRIVALKMILAGRLASRSAVQRFYTEAEAAAKLDHPNIVPIYEIAEQDGQHYFSMKFIEGIDLARVISSQCSVISDRSSNKTETGQRGEAPKTDHWPLITDYSHRRAAAHRQDRPRGPLRPSTRGSAPRPQTGNILLDASGEPFVTDFGLAKLIEGDTDFTLAVINQPVMSPEQASGQTKQLTTARTSMKRAVFYCSRAAPFR